MPRTIKRLLAECVTAARREGYRGTNATYEYTPADMEWITQQFGRKPTRGEWLDAGLGWVGDAHCGEPVITDAQIADIARATKRICAKNGMGSRVVVWPDGSWSEAVSDNDTVALLHDDGTRTYPLVRFQCPATREMVADAIADETKYRATFGDGIVDYEQEIVSRESEA